VHVCYGWILQCAAWSIIHGTNMRGMNSNCQIREICDQCTCFPTPYNPLFTSLHSKCLPMCLPHVNDLQTYKPNGTVTSERAVSFLWTVAWHVNVVRICFHLRGWVYLALGTNPTDHFLESRLSSESLEPLIGLLAYLEPKLWLKNQTLVKCLPPQMLIWNVFHPRP